MPTPNPAQRPASSVMAPGPESDGKPGLLGTFVLGVRVWAREMRRLAIGQAKLHEVRQLEARLREETALLARLEKAPGPERKLCLGQIELLKLEIARLRGEQEARTTAPPCRRPPDTTEPRL